MALTEAQIRTIREDISLGRPVTPSMRANLQQSQQAGRTQAVTMQPQRAPQPKAAMRQIMQVPTTQPMRVPIQKEAARQAVSVPQQVPLQTKGGFFAGLAGGLATSFFAPGLVIPGAIRRALTPTPEEQAERLRQQAVVLEQQRNIATQEQINKLLSTEFVERFDPRRLLPGVVFDPTKEQQQASLLASLIPEQIPSFVPSGTTGTVIQTKGETGFFAGAGTFAQQITPLVIVAIVGLIALQFFKKK